MPWNGRRIIKMIMAALCRHWPRWCDTSPRPAPRSCSSSWCSRSCPWCRTHSCAASALINHSVVSNRLVISPREQLKKMWIPLLYSPFSQWPFNPYMHQLQRSQSYHWLSLSKGRMRQREHANFCNKQVAGMVWLKLSPPEYFCGFTVCHLMDIRILALSLHNSVTVGCSKKHDCSAGSTRHKCCHDVPECSYITLHFLPKTVTEDCILKCFMVNYSS